MYWVPGNENECELKPWMTEYALFARDDYKRCVCEHWGNGAADCQEVDFEPSPVPEPTPGPEDGPTLDELFSGLEQIHSAPHYSEEEKSRTLYQADLSLR